MSKLRKTLANHTSLETHDTVEKQVSTEQVQKGNPESKGFFADAFELSRELIAELPIVPTNDRVYELVQDIERGDFEDISSIEDAYDYWPQWIDRTKEILRARRILISNKLRKLNK